MVRVMLCQPYTKLALLTVIILISVVSAAQEVRIGVLGLFHPQEFQLEPSKGSALIIHAGSDTIILEKTSDRSRAAIKRGGTEVLLSAGKRTYRASEITVTSRQNGSPDFLLIVPGKITRHYHGTLSVGSHSGALAAVVTMGLETAVASVVAAESAGDTPSEALKAQAIATRSYFVAGRGRHHDFDFCDTTHCQFLREPPPEKSPAAQAAKATRGLVLAYKDETIAAMYTRSCSGRTQTPEDVGMSSAQYPYYEVECKYCRQHPSRWQSRISEAEPLISANESSRLRVDRRLGWNAVPSNVFVMQKEGENTVLRGIGQGHGIGLCQAGSKAMAEEGADFRKILLHYYPNTTVIAMGGEPAEL